MDEAKVSEPFQLTAALVALRIEADTAAQAIGALSAVLMRQGLVTPGYAQAAIERERTSPTGLPTPGIGTAIPHAGTEHTLQPGMAVATLVHPVQFGEMGNPGSHVDVSIIFLLSVTEPAAQVYLLASITQMFRDAALLQKIHSATDPTVVVEQINAALACARMPRQRTLSQGGKS